ncbi:MAG: hypothetical protein PHW52_00485 [Candidatus Pacebacteria bacterium]|nr:hypothetical protein [Candidatus Paceibacterota bacterium]
MQLKNNKQKVGLLFAIFVFFLSILVLKEKISQFVLADTTITINGNGLNLNTSTDVAGVGTVTTIITSDSSGASTDQASTCSVFKAKNYNCGTAGNKAYEKTSTGDCLSAIGGQTSQLCKNSSFYNSDLVPAQGGCTWSCKTYQCAFAYKNSACGALNGTQFYSAITSTTTGLCAEGYVLVPGSINSTTSSYYWSCVQRTCTDADFSWKSSCTNGYYDFTKSGNCTGTASRVCPCQYTYSPWTNCDSSGTRKRTETASPVGCSSGNPETTDNCLGDIVLSARYDSEMKVSLSWNKLTVDNFAYYKIIRSQTNHSPFYPSDWGDDTGDKYLTDVSSTSYSYTEKSEPGTYYYRICSVANNYTTTPGGIKCSNVQTVVIPAIPVIGGRDPSVGGVQVEDTTQETPLISCGAANGKSFSSKNILIANQLCSISFSTSISITTNSDGSWGWYCGNTLCRAELAPTCKKFGSLTSVAGISFCESGTVSSDPRLFDGVWKWNCIGSGNSLIECTATQGINGECGIANDKSYSSLSASSQDLCKGTVKDFNEVDNKYTWKCSGINSDSIASCSASKVVKAACGTNATTFTTAQTSYNGTYCSSGIALVKPEFPALGVIVSWNCTGTNSETITCYAKRAKDAACGTSNEGSFTSAPTSNLCDSGNTSTVSGTGPWTWVCSGINGGKDISCSANSSSLNKRVNGECGPANGGEFGPSPNQQLCSYGNPSEVKVGSSSWIWTCLGLNGGGTASCSAKIKYCSYRYSDWGPCAANGTQTRSVIDSDSNCYSYPEPKTFRSCSNECTYNYRDGECKDGFIKRTLIDPIPQNCTNQPVYEVSCVTKIDCTDTKWQCGDWGECARADGSNQWLQLRSCKLLTGCESVENRPEISRSCTVPQVISPTSTIPAVPPASDQNSTQSNTTPAVSVPSTQTTISSVDSTASTEPAVTPSMASLNSEKTEIVSVIATTDNLDKKCAEAGLKNALSCNKYIAQLNIVKECLKVGRKTREECRAYLLDRYGNPIKCDQFREKFSREEADKQCENFINNVILADLNDNIDDNTVKELEDSSGKLAILDTVRQVIRVRDKNNQEKEIRLEKIPLSKNNNDIKVSLMPISKIDNSTAKSPVAIIFDENQNGIPDEIEERLKYIDISNPKNLSGVDRALLTGKTIEQPKDSQSISAALAVDVNNNDNGSLTFSGKTYPNQVVSLFIYSPMPIVVTIKSDANGNWIYDLDKGLSNGKHEAYIAINNSDGQLLEASVPKLFFIAEARAVALDDYLGIQPANISNFGEKRYDDLLTNYVGGGIIVILILITGFLLIKKILTSKHE